VGAAPRARGWAWGCCASRRLTSSLPPAPHRKAKPQPCPCPAPARVRVGMQARSLKRVPPARQRAARPEGTPSRAPPHAPAHAARGGHRQRDQVAAPVPRAARGPGAPHHLLPTRCGLGGWGRVARARRELGLGCAWQVERVHKGLARLTPPITSHPACSSVWVPVATLAPIGGGDTVACG